MVRSPGPGMERKSGFVPMDDAALVELDWSIAEGGAADPPSGVPSAFEEKRELVVPDDTPASCCKTEATSLSRLSFFLVTGLCKSGELKQ